MTPVCTNEYIDAPWVTSLGYTYKKQGPSDEIETWMNETIREHKIPLGGEIVFYCNDPSRRKRPRKDDRDGTNDGLLYGYCTYSGRFDIPMSPASVYLIFHYNFTDLLYFRKYHSIEFSTFRLGSM